MQKNISIIAIITVISTAGAAPPPQSQVQATKPPLSTGLVNSLEKTTKTLKQNPKALKKIDTFVEESANDIKTTIKKISDEIGPEKLKAAEKVCKEEANEACKELEALFKHHSKKLEEKIEQTVGNKTKDKAVEQASACSQRIQNAARNLSEQEPVKKLGKDLEAANKAEAENLSQIVGANKKNQQNE